MIPKHLEESIAYLKEKGFDRPEVGIVLGTGLGQLVNHLDSARRSPLQSNSFFPACHRRVSLRKITIRNPWGKKSSGHARQVSHL